MKRFFPYLLIGIRLTITFFALLDALDRSTGGWFVAGFCVAVLLDFFDGMLARRLGVETQGIRRADSIADFVMVVVYLFIGWLLFRAAFTPYLLTLIALIGLTVLTSVLARARFNRVPPLHTNITRLTGIILFFAAIQLFIQGTLGLLFQLGLLIGFLSQVERIAITFTLPTYPKGDISGYQHALKLRKKHSPQAAD